LAGLKLQVEKMPWIDIPEVATVVPRRKEENLDIHAISLLILYVQRKLLGSEIRH
jgi:hypothetical protein